MKIITATAATQGRRSNDYHWCVEGEVVLPALMICAADSADPDGGCGCGRGWAGAGSQRATTTAMVRDVPFTMAEYTEAIRSGLEQGGWWPEPVDDDSVRYLAACLSELAASCPVGAVLEKRLDVVMIR